MNQQGNSPRRTPPPPPVINRQAPRSQSPNNMNQQGNSPRRTPPPPPPVINRPAPRPQSPNNMNQQGNSPRRTPPPPPVPARPPSRNLSNSYTTDTNLAVDHYLRQINTLENPPVRIIKPNAQDVIYRKEIRIRYLKPPTPPPPAPIIIREKQLPPISPQSVQIKRFIFS
jgi:hypothetical protein